MPLALLLVSLLAITALVSGEVLSRTRGAPTPEELVERYLEGMRSNDPNAVAWLMAADREDRAAIARGLERYRRIPLRATLDVEHTQHSDAAYLKGAKVRFQGEVIDEIGMQHQGSRFGDRWRLFFPPAR